MDDLRPLFPAVIAVSFTLLAFGAPLPAQQPKVGATKSQPAKPGATAPATKPKPSTEPAGTATSGTKKKSPVRQVEGTDDDIEAPNPRPKARRTESDEDEAPARIPARRSLPARTSVDDGDDRRRPAGDEPPQGGNRLPRPAAEPLRIQKLSPELEQILKEWERHTAKIQKLEGDTRYREIDKTFSKEFRAEGKFAFEAPDRGNYELRPVKIAKGEVSAVKDDDKIPYELKPKDAERWVCTGSQIIQINEAQKTYDLVEIPEERRGDRIIDAPLPFLFGMKAEQAKQRYQIELAKQTDQDIVLQLRPNWSGDAANWSKATVVISKSNYLPREVRLIAPGGTSMRVHTFDNIKVNSDSIFRSLFGDDPFKPKLKNYKAVVSSAPETPAVADRTPAANAKAKPASAETAAGKPNTPKKGDPPPRTADAGEKRKPTSGTKK